MNIGIVCFPTYGGSGVVATELGKALAQKGYNIHFISYDRPFRLVDDAPNIHYHEVVVSDYALFEYPPYELSLTNEIVDVARYEKLDLLHVHYAIPHAASAYLAKQILSHEGINLPVITTLHGTDITLVGKDPSYNSVITFAINHSDGVTAVSEWLKKETQKYFNVIKEIIVIPNFVCLEEVYDKVKHEDAERLKKTYAPGGEKILLHISNFRKVKRVEDIVKVFAEVRNRLPAKLLLVGDGPEMNIIEQLCRQLNTCKDIVFLGKYKATEQILSCADLFMLTSETESFGLAALEAMASRVPVISTNTGGLPELNIHGKTGFLSNVGDVADMAKNALSLLEDEKKHEGFRKNARLRAEKFDISRVLPEYESLYTLIVQAE